MLSENTFSLSVECNSPENRMGCPSPLGFPLDDIKPRCVHIRTTVYSSTYRTVCHLCTLGLSRLNITIFRYGRIGGLDCGLPSAYTSLFVTFGLATLDLAAIAEKVFPDIDGLTDFATGMLGWLPTFLRPRITLAMGIGVGCTKR